MCGILCGIYWDKNCAFCRADSEIELIKKDNVNNALPPPEVQNAAKMIKSLKRRGPDISSKACLQNDTGLLHLEGHVLWTRGPQISAQPYRDEEDYFLFNGDLYSYSDPGINDGELFFQDLKSHLNKGQDIQSFPFNKLNGPYAFIYARRGGEKIYFGRDFLGKSSLILNQCKSGLVLSSIALSSGNCIEVPSLGIYTLENGSNLKLIQWEVSGALSRERGTELQNLKEFCDKSSIHFQVLSNSVIIPNISTSLCPLLLPFENDSKFREMNSIANNPNFSKSEQFTLAAEIFQPEIKTFTNLLQSSIQKRVENIPRNSTISILFSGGVDSTLIAILASSMKEFQLPIELINVAFFDKDESTTQSVPDRLTGLQSYEILHQTFPTREILFKSVNINKEQVQKSREERTRDLILPLKSVLDDSIGNCLWFAARGASSRAIFVGSGADELFGGYSRHRSAFSEGGWEGLQREMQRDMDRISVRNLGRDNRILSDHSLTPRLPFLDETVVSFVTSSLPLYTKYFPGFSDKLLLRLSIYSLLRDNNNLNESICDISLFPKRAMQFGSRIAKLEDRKEKGNDICKRLT